MKLRIEITAKHKADALEVYSLARDAAPGTRPPAPRDGEWFLALDAERSTLARVLRAVDPHLGAALSADVNEAATRRLRWVKA